MATRQRNQVKRMDSLGRLFLGQRLAGRFVTIEQTGTTKFVVTVVPKREEWAHQPAVAATLKRAFRQARNRQFVEPPDLTWPK